MCDHPRDPRAKSCIKCHARNNALRNQASGVTQTDEVRARRVKSYRATRMDYVPDGMEDANRHMRNAGIPVQERKRIFGAQIVRDTERAMRERNERLKKQEY